jgi:ribosomal protein S18 acetylase RimI-like enzyme
MQFQNSTSKYQIKSAAAEDFDGIWEIFHAVVSTGTYVYATNTSKEEARILWMPPHKETFVAWLDNKIVATWFIKPNQAGHGSHVANGVYMVHPDFQGMGIGKQMVLHSLEAAKKSGYLAIQFNLVVSSNIAAVKLYQNLGFNIIGTTPNGFKDDTNEFIDTYIMHRAL